MLTPFDPATEYDLIKSDTPVDVDGYKLGEPKRLACADCGASVVLTREPSAGVDELPHEPGCSQRGAVSEWWVENVLE